MNRFFDAYLRKLMLLIASIIAIVLIWNSIFPQWKASPWWPFYLTFFFLITVVIHYTLLNSLKSKPQRFVGMFMAVTLGKLVLYMVALILNVIYTPFNKPSIIVPFLAFYVLFTFFEVKQLSAIVGTKKPEDSNAKN